MKTDDYDQPVAYDADGQPLYAHPPVQAKVDMDNVHVTRPLEVKKLVVSDELKAKHDASMKLYPSLNLSEGEHVISAVRRHPIGLIVPIFITALLMIIVIIILALYPTMTDSLTTSTNISLPRTGDIMLVGFLFLLLFAIGGYVAVWVYVNNKFFLTNESVIQNIQTSLFNKREQTVSLENIEDASFRQNGFIQVLFDYGTIRLSTQGDETTYRFHYVWRPKEQIALLNNAVEAFKLGRAVE